MRADLESTASGQSPTATSGMDDSDVFVKTASGLDEMRTRALQLSQRLRAMLIMFDGTRTVAQLRHAQLALGAPPDFLESLVALGLVASDRASARAAPAAAPVALVDVELGLPASDTASADEAEKYRAALKFMNDTAVDLMGLRAVFFTLKIEKCFTMADLKELIPHFSAAITKSKGPEIARALEERVRRMIQ